MSDKIISNGNDDMIRCEIVSILTDKINSIMGSEEWLRYHIFTTDEVKSIINDTFKFFNDSLYGEFKNNDNQNITSDDKSEYWFVNGNTVYWTLAIIRSYVNDKTDRMMIFKLSNYILDNLNYAPDAYLSVIKDGNHDITMRAEIMSILKHIKVDQPK